MCGRLVVSEPDLSVFVEPFHVQHSDVSEWQPRFNLAPTQLAPLITNEPVRRLTLARFGLVPAWARDPKLGQRLINARVEGVARSKVFKQALLSRRGVVPATGYYEWRATARGKQPVFIQDAQGHPLALAALWESWRSPSGETLTSFAVLTRPATGFIADIHSRMPFTLRPGDVEQWLSAGAQPLSALSDILNAEANISDLCGHPVSSLVNAPRNDGPQCIAEVEEPARTADRQLELFESIRAHPHPAQVRRTR